MPIKLRGIVRSIGVRDCGSARRAIIEIHFDLEVTRAMVNYIAKVRDGFLLELPEAAHELGLRSGDEVEVSVGEVSNRQRAEDNVSQSSPQERARAFRTWAEAHSRDLPLLSDDDVSRESIYGERG
jgi:hypothetical protein